MPVVHISERDWELGKYYPTELALRANVKETLRALLPLLRERRTPAGTEEAKRRLAALKLRNWTAQRKLSRVVLAQFPVALADVHHRHAFRQRRQRAVDRHAQQICAQTQHEVERRQQRAHLLLVTRQGAEIGRMRGGKLRAIR